MKSITYFISLLGLWTVIVSGTQPPFQAKTCVIPAHGDGQDDSPAIRSAFSACGRNGHIIFAENNTYNIQTVLQLHNLSNVQIDFLGTLLVAISVSNDEI